MIKNGDEILEKANVPVLDDDVRCQLAEIEAKVKLSLESNDDTEFKEYLEFQVQLSRQLIYAILDQAKAMANSVPEAAQDKNLSKFLKFKEKLNILLKTFITILGKDNFTKYELNLYRDMLDVEDYFIPVNLRSSYQLVRDEFEKIVSYLTMHPDDTDIERNQIIQEYDQRAKQILQQLGEVQYVPDKKVVHFKRQIK